jgi:hypothetical protein
LPLGHDPRNRDVSDECTPTEDYIGRFGRFLATITFLSSRCDSQANVTFFVAKVIQIDPNGVIMSGACRKQQAEDRSMRVRSIKAIGCVVTVLAAGVVGCVKRTEFIVVKPDRSVTILLAAEGDAEDMESIVQPLASAPGWETTEKRDLKNDGKVEVTRTAKKTFPAGAALPSHWPTDDSEKAALELKEETSVSYKQRDDGTYVHFRRTYQPRKWAMVNYWKKNLLEKFDEKDFGKMTEDERMDLAGAFIEAHRSQVLAILREAAVAADVSWPQDLRLEIESAVTAEFHNIDAEEVVAMLQQNADAKDAEKHKGNMKRLAERVNSDVESSIKSVMIEWSVSRREIASFLENYKREQLRFAMTEDYQDERWEIRLELPGELVGHNGDKIEDGRVVWNLKGEGFCDRVVELLATSRLR